MTSTKKKERKEDGDDKGMHSVLIGAPKKKKGNRDFTRKRRG